MKFRTISAKEIRFHNGAKIRYDEEEEAFIGTKPDGETEVNLETGELATAVLAEGGIVSFTATDEQASKASASFVGRQIGLMFVDGGLYDHAENTTKASDASNTISFDPPLAEGSKVVIVLMKPA